MSLSFVRSNESFVVRVVRVASWSRVSKWKGHAKVAESASRFESRYPYSVRLSRNRLNNHRLEPHLTGCTFEHLLYTSDEHVAIDQDTRFVLLEVAHVAGSEFHLELVGESQTELFV